MTAALVAAALALTAGACTTSDEPRPTPPAVEASPTSEPVRPVVVETELDGEPVDLEVGPLAVHGDVAVLRLAAPVAESAMLLSFDYTFEGNVAVGPTGVRLVDPTAGTVTHPARTAEGRTVTTSVGSPGGPATDAAHDAAGDDVSIVHAAFAAPASDTAHVLLPRVGWVADVPVVDASEADALTVPPSEVRGDPPVPTPPIPLDAYTEVLDGEVRSRTTEEQVTVTVSSDVLFAFDSDQLAPEAAAALQAAAAEVAAYEGGALAVVGHTDDQGDEAYNVDLSRRRATTVAARLEQLVDLSSFDVSVDGRGEAEPAVAGSGEAERATNRRVELVLRTAGAAPRPAAEVTGELPEPAGPVASGATGLEVTDRSGGTFEIRLPEVRRIGRYLVGALEMTNTGDDDLSTDALGVTAWDTRGAFDPRLGFAPTNVTLAAGSTRYFPLDYVDDPQKDRRSPLVDRIVNGIAPGETRRVTVVWPDPGGHSVTVEVAPRFHRKMDLQVGGHSPFRLTDVPVVEE